MMRFLPKSLAGQLIAVLLLALVVAQVASLHVLRDDRRLAFIFVAQQEVMSRTASVVRLLNETEPPLHDTIVDAASSPRLRFQLADNSAAASDDENEGLNRFLQKRLAWELSDEAGEVRVIIHEGDDDDDDEDDASEDAREDDEDNDGHNPFWVPNDERRFREWRRNNRGERRINRRHDMRGMRHFDPSLRGSRIGMTISVAIKGSSSKPWLNVYSMVPPTSPAVAIPSLITIAIMAVLLVIIVIFMVRRTTRPVAKLADSAERFGRGEDVALLPEMGPEDIRKATRAFNEMQERLTRFVKDRTRMLAAITHDLRTPITSLRIRAEMIEDEEAREKILETLAEMQNLTEAALDFARQEASDEPTRSVDLVALVDSLCADLAAVGQAVIFNNGEPERLPYACHPLALKRALRNVIENAVRYGEQAEVDITLDDQEVCLNVNDHGPGISADMREQIFEPFFRLEDSRNRETGGIGLGLAIARTIVRSHGGDIRITDSDSGGARFSLCLPRQN
ncbi:MAG: HAMP domain-containing histidine kinase [Rhodospirillaceae bacterium]|jgi:signal transduction histidine kinase|nr:HAMP domain-containing histidine kinase [Rhodospirillaceae bacterium]MBT7956088.1 HAMP domain-containing histidine kinase [Rhodospirillaceae bacterium]